VNDETGARILTLLDVLSVQMAEGHAELRRDIRGLDANVSGLDAKVDRLDRCLGPGGHLKLYQAWPLQNVPARAKWRLPGFVYAGVFAFRFRAVRLCS
jgi:hypothetical protein